MKTEIANMLPFVFGLIHLISIAAGLSYGKTRTIEEEPYPRPYVKECPYINCPYQNVPVKCLVPTAYWYEGRLCQGCYRNVCRTYTYPSYTNSYNSPSYTNSYNNQPYNNNYNGYNNNYPRRRRTYSD